MGSWVRVSAALLVCVLVGAPIGAHPVASCSWPMYAHDPGHSAAQSAECAAIGVTNVATLRPAWAIPTGDNITASPSVADGILYVGSWDGTFYAIDAVSGEQLWTFTVDDASRVAFGRIVSTASIASVRVPSVGAVDVVLFGGGATLYALKPGREGPVVLAKISADPRTAEDRAKQAENPPQVEIESSPVVGHFPDGDRIFVGMDVHNREKVGRTGLLSFGLRRDENGPTPYRFELLYKFDPETGIVRHSLTDGSGTGWGCGGVWSSPVVAPTALGPGDGVVVFGTSNCDNPAESAAAGEIGRETMFGIDAKTGEELWRFAPREPNDIDDDFGSSANLLPGGGVGEGGKDGWYYAFDLRPGPDGKPVERWRAHAAQPGHINTGFAVGGFIGTPAVGEATDPVSGETRTAVFGATSIPTPIGPPVDSGENPIDTTLVTDGDPLRLLSLHAMDAETGEILWRAPLASPTYGHVTYANGVVFVALTTGLRIAAFDAGTGLPLWLTPTFGAPSGAAVVVGDMLFFGTGTRESDAEFKAFGDQIQELVSGPLGEHPLSRLSGIFGYKLAP